MNSKTLVKCSDHCWTNGNLVIGRYDYLKLPWVARWQGFLSSKHEIAASTRKELMERLRPYGMAYVFGRKGDAKRLCKSEHCEANSESGR